MIPLLEFISVDKDVDRWTLIVSVMVRDCGFTNNKIKDQETWFEIVGSQTIR